MLCMHSFFTAGHDVKILRWSWYGLRWIFGRSRTCIRTRIRSTRVSSDAGAPSTATGASEYALMHSVVLTGSRGLWSRMWHAAAKEREWVVGLDLT